MGTLLEIKPEQGSNVWARGRNGMFKPRAIRVFKYEAGNMIIDVASRRAGNHTPITFSLNTPDAEKLACSILGISESTYNRVKVPEGYEVAMAVWSPEDVFQKAREMGKCVTLVQANNVLIEVEDHQDCSYGITWDTLEFEIDQLDDLEHLPDCIHPVDDQCDEILCIECKQFNGGKADGNENK